MGGPPPSCGRPTGCHAIHTSEPAAAPSPSAAAWRKPRDLLPLPLLDDDGPVAAHLSRDVRRRITRRQRWQAWANEGISAVNQMGHEGKDPVCAPPVASLSQTKCLDEVAKAYREMPLDVADRNFGAGALRALCSKSSGYTGDRDDIQPYSPERVSWPPNDFKPVSLDSLLGADDVHWWAAWKTHLLRPVDREVYQAVR